MEVFLDQPDFPQVFGRAQVFQVVRAIDVDQAELAVLAGIALFGEPFVENQMSCSTPSGVSPPGRLRQMTSVLRPSGVVPVTVRNQ